jgi:hypothetical protein
MSNKFNESFTREMNRFTIVDESTSSAKIPFNRERTGGLTPGDRIKFAENILSSEWFKNQPDNVRQLVKELHDGDLNLFVDGVSGADDDIRVIIARELAPGFQCPHKVELPSNLCEFLASTGNRAEAPIPDSWRGPERVTIKPELVKPVGEDVADSPEEQTLKADDGKGKLQDVDASLPEKDTPGSKGGDYTVDYMTNSFKSGKY